jgi:MarR family transcriptional regulator for hemolysin
MKGYCMQYTLDDNIGWLVYKARHVLKKRMQDKLKDYGISSEQWSVLNMVYMKGGCNQKTLAELLLKDGGTITRILNILEDKELIKREKSPYDKREFLIHLTDKGLDLYNELFKVMLQNKQEINFIFSTNEQKQLIFLLNKLFSSLE